MSMQKRLSTVLVIGLLLGGWFGGRVDAQGPFTAQIQRALRAFGISGTPGTFTVPVKGAASGTCVTPSYTFTGDTDTGVGWLGANNAAGCAGGATIFDWNASRFLSAVPIYSSAGTVAAPAFARASQPGTGIWFGGSSNEMEFAINGTGKFGMVDSGSFSLASDVIFGWASGALRSGLDTILARDAANTLAQLNGTNAQRFNIYNTYTSSTNNEGGYLWWDSNNFYVGTFKGSGGGTARQLILATDNTSRWTIGATNGNLLAASDNIFDIGASGATRPRTGYFGTSVVSPILQGSGTGTSVANVGANSCGTTAATIAGNQVSGVITVGATAGTQCRVTFSTAAPVARDCTVTDSTTTIATRATAVSTTTHDFLGAFVAGDLVTYQCTVR